MIIELPFPPSLNRLYRNVQGRTLISREGRIYRAQVCSMLDGGGPRKPPSDGRIALAMDAFPPDRRRRDLDNTMKGPLDALEHAGLYTDDSQIDLLIARRCEVTPGGRLIVRMMEMPLQCCPLCGVRYCQTESGYPHNN